MTLVDEPTRAGLREVETGVARLPGDALEPVVVVATESSIPDPALAAAMPLLTRRRQVFTAGPDVSPGELPERFAFLVTPGSRTPLVDERVSALILMEPAVPAPDVRCPILLIGTPPWPATPATADLRAAEARHPAERAHLIDAFLREPGRYPAGSMIPRAQP